MTTHRLKCWTEFYNETAAGRKKAELRFNDRDFKVGDWLILQDFDPVKESFSGREVSVEVTHVLANTPHLKPGYVLLSHGWPGQTFKSAGYNLDGATHG